MGLASGLVELTMRETAMVNVLCALVVSTWGCRKIYGMKMVPAKFGGGSITPLGLLEEGKLQVQKTNFASLVYEKGLNPWNLENFHRRVDILAIIGP